MIRRNKWEEENWEEERGGRLICVFYSRSDRDYYVFLEGERERENEKENENEEEEERREKTKVTP